MRFPFFSSAALKEVTQHARAIITSIPQGEKSGGGVDFLIL